MIKVTVRQAAEKRGIKNAYRLAQKLQGTDVGPDAKHQRLASKLWKGNVQPALETIDRVAEALDCGLEELLVRVPNKRTKPSTPQGRTSGTRKLSRRVTV